jgi:hypothetical protein
MLGRDRSIWTCGGADGVAAMRGGGDAVAAGHAA